MTRVSAIFASLALVAMTGACSKADSKSDEAQPAAQPTATAQVAAKAAPAATPEKATPAAVEIGTLTADELEGLIDKGDCTVLDANGERVRKEFGKIPTATLLTSYEYELSELPADKDSKLVFYCSNTQCGASKKGAKRALTAGYTDVNVLPVGVMGWKEAGKKTEDVI